MTTLAQGHNNIPDGILRGAQRSLEAFLSLLTFDETSGLPVDVKVAEFQLFDITGGLPGTQIFPVTIGQRESVNVSGAVPSGDRISKGHYAAPFTLAVTGAIGAHEIRWFFKRTLTSAEQTFTEPFTIEETVKGAANYKVFAGSGAGYCTITEVREQGPPFNNATTFPDAKIQKAIDSASRRIERLTNRFFDPRLMSVLHDGDNTHDLMMDNPIIEVSALRLLEDIGGLILTTDAIELDDDEFVVYNRHISQRLEQPDDRDNPMLSLDFSDFQPDELDRTRLLRTRTFPRGRQNIQVVGVFGYTDPAPFGETDEIKLRYGVTPLFIRELCLMMVVTPVGGVSSGLTGPAGNCDPCVTSSHRIVKRKSGSQTTEFKPRREGMLTGDPDVDRELAKYTAPIVLGAV